MSATALREPEVTRPTPPPVTSSLLDHFPATTRPRFGRRTMPGDMLWPSYNCLDLLTPTVLACEPLPARKVFGSPEWMPAFEFAVYGGAKCQAVGLDVEDQKAEVARVFEASQSKGVERALLYTRFATPESDDQFPWDEPTNLTPGASVSLIVALALLEGDAAANYSGLPVIHMPRAASVVLEASGLIVWNGDLAFTKNGSRVVMGGGYDDPDMLASGDWTLYATGEVVVEQSGKIALTEPVLPGQVDPDSDDDDLHALEENNVLTLAERQFRVAIDCYAAQATGHVF